MGVFDTTMPTADNMAGAGPANVGQTIANTNLITQQAKQTQQQTANLKAQELGLITDSADKARTLNGKMWYGQNSDQWTTPAEVDPKTGVMGQPTIDYAKLGAAANAHGYTDIVQGLLKPYQDSVTTQLSQATSQTDLNQKRATQSIQAGGVIGNAVNSAPAGQKEDTYNQVRARLASTLGPGIINDQTIPAKYDAGNIEGMIGATLTPLDKVKMVNDTNQTNAIVQNSDTTAKTLHLTAGDRFQRGTQFANQSGTQQSAVDGVKDHAALPQSLLGRGEEAYDQYVKGDPALAFLDAQNKIVNAKYGTTTNWTEGMDAVVNNVKKEAIINNKAADADFQGAKAGGFVADTSPAKAPVATIQVVPPKAALKPDSNGMVKVKNNKTGQTGKMPADKVNSNYTVIQ